MSFFRDDEKVVPVFHNSRLPQGMYSHAILVGYSYEDQDINDLLVHVTVPHVVTSRPRVIQDRATGHWHLFEQELGKQIQYPIARTVHDWNVTEEPHGNETMTEVTNELRRRVTAQETERKELAAAQLTGKSLVGEPSPPSVLHPGKPAEKPWGVKDPAPEDEVYDVLRTFMLGKQVRIVVCSRVTEAPLYEYVGILANYVLGYDLHSGKNTLVTFRFINMGKNEDISLDMKAYILEIELISAS